MSQVQEFGSSKALDPEAPSKPILFDVLRSKSLPTKALLVDSPSGPSTETSWIGSDSSDTDSLCDDFSRLGTIYNSIENELALPSLSCDKNAVRPNHLVSPEDSSISMQRNPRRIFQTTQFDTDPADKKHTYIASSVLQPNVHCCQPSHRVRKPLATSHYFREKKWDLFPELDPSLQARDVMTPCNCHTESQEWATDVQDSAKRDRWTTLNKLGLNLLCDARDWVKIFVHRKIVKTKEEKRLVPPTGELR